MAVTYVSVSHLFLAAHAHTHTRPPAHTHTGYCPNPIAGAWPPSLLGFRSTFSNGGDNCHGVVELGWNSTLHDGYGAPAGATVVYDVDPISKRVNVTFIWRNKTASRLQEAMTVFFRPANHAISSTAPNVLEGIDGVVFEPRWSARAILRC